MVGALGWLGGGLAIVLSYLGKTLNSNSVSLYPPVYEWVLSNFMLWGVSNPEMD